MNVNDKIRELASCIKDPHEGLGEDIFLFFSRNTPMINVDLLIKNDRNEILLTWRDDRHHEAGWHIPGGVIRYKETAAERIKAVAMSELGANVEFKDTPMHIEEIILPDRKERAHFISLLYECKLTTAPDEQLKAFSEPFKAGQWAWHGKCPHNIINVHKFYKYLWS